MVYNKFMKFYPLANLHGQTQNLNSKEFTTLLFQRTATLEGLQKEFTKILLYSRRRRHLWLDKHQDFIFQMLQHVRQESTFVINEVLTQQTGEKQLTEYMVTLQQTLITLEKIVDEVEEIRD